MLKLTIFVLFLICFTNSQSISDMQGTWRGIKSDGKRVNMTLEANGKGFFSLDVPNDFEATLTINGGLYSILLVPGYNWNNGIVAKLNNKTSFSGVYIHYGSLRNPYSTIKMNKV
jgi:hypothetical protein